MFLLCSFTAVQATISITNFQALQTESSIDLEWITISEENTGIFMVQFSTDGKSWEEISSVQAAGTSTEELTYTFNHNIVPDAEHNIFYYRLKVISADGNSFLFSDIISIVITNPAPVEETVQVYFDLSGKSFATLDNAPSGIYIVAKGKERTKIYLSTNR
ncbi:MAG: hypothetical protein H7Y00_05760 [Fimbriimonadaceae bacterium]|nr:hypothetical protein [Chitinophagales bacterium]